MVASFICTDQGRFQVILFTPGEVNATRYTTYLGPKRLTGTFAQALGAAVIVLEHRYWGLSSPFANLSSKNLEYLTLSNSIADLTNFARHAVLPFDLQGSSHAPYAPWLLSGGSYSGSLAAWTATTSPGTFWAYTATSAPVEAISDFWEYFAPVQAAMPQNCSKDVSLVIDYVDNLLEHGTVTEQLDLKRMFGIGGVQHNDDFMAFLENLPWMWQGNQFYVNTGFFTACDFVENANTNGSIVPGTEGVGLEKALAGYARWVNSTLLPGFCAGYGYTDDQYDTSCLDTYNASNPIFTDWSLGNTGDRQWQWFLCNEPFGWWQDGAPAVRPSIVSRLVTAEYWQRQCALYFPPEDEYTFGSARGKTEAQVNAYTGGWYPGNTTRLLYINGDNDPWRSGGVSSDFRPGGKLQSTPEQPVLIVPGGHVSFLLTLRSCIGANSNSATTRPTSLRKTASSTPACVPFRTRKLPKSRLGLTSSQRLRDLPAMVVVLSVSCLGLLTISRAVGRPENPGRALVS